jgi:hypothetical protein
MCLVDGRLNIVPPIIPEAQEFVHFNELWCYLFYKLTGEENLEKDDKGIAAFTIVPAKNLTIATLLDRVFPAIPATDNKPMPYVTTKTVAYIFALIIESVTIFHEDSPHFRALQHEASILEALNAMPADELRTELRDSLTVFYENILKKAGTGGRPVAKPLISKFVTKAAPVPEDPPSGQAGADNNAAYAAIGPSAAAVEPASAAPAPQAPEKEPPVGAPARGGTAAKGGKPKS